MTPKTIKTFIIAFLLISLTGIGYLKLTHFFEIDSCLDKGGHWNYEKQVCELDSNSLPAGPSGSADTLRQLKAY